MIRIEGEKIVIRELNKNDVYTLFEIAKNKEVAKYISIPHPYKISDAINFIERSRKKIKKSFSYELGIELKSTKQIIGIISLTGIDYKNKNAEISIWLGKKFWGKGLAQESIRLMLDFGFYNLNLKRIWAKVIHLNKRSINLCKKTCFLYEGKLRKNIFRNGKWMDHLIFALLKEEWKKLNKRRCELC